MAELVSDPLNMIITGVGGQGNVLMSQVLGRALLDSGFLVTVGETFGLSQRGGSVTSHIRVSTRREYGPLIPRNQAQVICGLEPLETLRVIPEYGQPKVQVMVNSRPLPPLNVTAGSAVYPDLAAIESSLRELTGRVWWIKATDAARNLGAAIMANIVLLGALTGAGLVPLEARSLEKALKAVLPPDRLEVNLTAFREGIRLIDNGGH